MSIGNEREQKHIRRLFALLLILGLLMGGALGEGRYLHVTDVDEFVLMRESPKKWWRQLMQIPKDALVWQEDAEEAAENGFLRVCYAGQNGYVQVENLRETSPLANEDLVPMYVVNGKDEIRMRVAPATVSAVRGRLSLGEEVQVKQDVEGKFSYVWYQGVDGYILDAQLTYLPIWNNIIRSAELHVPGKKGADFVQTVDRAEAELLNELIRFARCTEEAGDCSLGAQLCLVLEDGTPEGRQLKFMMPLDGRLILVAENEAVYRIAEEYSEDFWGIFSKVRDLVLK